MGQNQSYPEGSTSAHTGDSENGSSGVHMSGPSDASEDPSTRDVGDKKAGVISQAQSVRAAIDTLIESCLVAKDDGMNGDTVKAPTVGYSLEQLSSLKDNTGGDEASSEDKKSLKKESAADKDENCASEDKDDDSSPKTFGSLMEKSIIELIKKEDDDQDDLSLIGKLNAKPVEGPGKSLAGSDKISSEQQQSKSVTSDKNYGKPVLTKVPITLSKRTVRLQTLIDTVLDNSLAHDMPSIFEKRKNDALINDLLIGKCENEAKNVAPRKPSPPKSTKTTAMASEAKDNKMVYLMDHIEKVLERNFEASNKETEDDSNLHILNRLSWESPPASTSAPTQSTEASPKLKQSENQSRASSGSNSSEGTISVQDIVDRVISQTEVISKLLSPSDSAASRAGKDSCKTSSAISGGSSSSSNQLTSNQVASKSMEQSRSPQSRPSSGSHLVDGHSSSSKAVEYASSRGRPRASTYDSQQMWNIRHAQEARAVMSRSLEKNSQEYRQLDVATSVSDGLHSMSKPGKSIPSPNYGSGPLVLPPYMNSLAPTSGILSFAQSPVFRPPGHQVFMPRYPLPLLRVDLPSDGPQGLPPHPPNASCACVACVSKFRLDEHSPKHGLLGPVSPSSGMLSPHGQVDSGYYQQRLATQLHSTAPGQHSPFVMRGEYSRPRCDSPGRHPGGSTAPQIPPVSSKQGVVAQMQQKTVHYPPAVPLSGYPPREPAEFHDYTSYEKQKLEMLKSERSGYHRPHQHHLQQISIQNPFETPRPDVFSNVDHNVLAGRLEPGVPGSEEHGRGGGGYEDVVDKRLHPLPSQLSPAQAVVHDDTRREKPQVSSQILDLTVKNETRAHDERLPSRSEPQQSEDTTDQPLDLSKKSAAPSFGSDYVKRQQIHTPKVEAVGFRKPDVGIKPEGNSKPAHHQLVMDGSAGRYGYPQQREGHPYPGVGPTAFNMGSRLPGPAEMAPTVNPNMLLAPGGQRPQLHPLPAPSLATSLMPTSSTAAMLQTYMAGGPLPNHALPPGVDQREKLSISIAQQKSKSSSESVMKAQRESPQMDSPDNLEKGDLTGRRNSAGRNEPIQSIIGNHNPNDILYLICRICRQSNGSPYAFRKHFRNHHGFEPKAEHTIVQTISATKSARQNPYSSNGPEGDCVPEQAHSVEDRNSVERTQSQGSSESCSLETSTPNETSNKSKTTYGRSGDGKHSGSKESREDTKYLECPECKQTFQLNDFGSYKRHCRQHNQSRSSGSFVSPELSESQDPGDKMQGGITMCKMCGVPFSVHYIEDHIRSVHGCFCSHCPDVFKTPEELHSHVRSHHSSTNFLPVASSPGTLPVPSPGVRPVASPGVRLSPRIHSPSHASLHSPNSPHHRSPSRSTPSVSTPSPGSVSQTKTNRDIRSSPSETGLCSPSTKPAGGGGGGGVSLGRVSSAAESSSSYGPISSTCEIERVPADNLTISASPDSSSDNVAKSCPSVSVVSDITVSCSLTSRESSEDRGKVVSTVRTNRSKGDDDMDSTISGSPTDMIIDLPPANGEVPSYFYKHKKFGGHRKRAESSDGSEVSAKVMKHGKDDSASGQNVNEDSSSSSCSSVKSNDGEKSEERIVAKEQSIPAVQTKAKVDGRVKQEARHQLPFVWDRVTRIQAGKNIKPPDYMT